MPTVHQENADSILKQIKASAPQDSGSVRAQFDTLIPSWQVSASGERGYSDDPQGETVICIARALHEGLPNPFNLFPFDWRNQHGMNVAIVYLSQPVTPVALDAWLDGAIAYNATALANA